MIASLRPSDSACLLLARVLSWLVLLARSDAANDVEILSSSCSDTRSPYCADTTYTRR
jgi:hypothetical protein